MRGLIALMTAFERSDKFHLTPLKKDRKKEWRILKKTSKKNS